MVGCKSWYWCCRAVRVSLVVVVVVVVRVVVEKETEESETEWVSVMDGMRGGR